ncbi:Hpt domain-containing protein [Bradyrhizobium sp.]|uniref:Hpt domain-containing protein n=1 Tax=Bradyrhizobium sp. TaxID=376 RepID=UPI003C5B02D1
MYTDRFEMCVARVRHRFATTLENKIETTMMSAGRMSRGDSSGIKTVSNAYRHLHGIYGVGATVGFAATGEAAHAAESALIQAYHEERGLTETEVRSLKQALARLRDVAASELRVMYQRGG